MRGEGVGYFRCSIFIVKKLLFGHHKKKQPSAIAYQRNRDMFIVYDNQIMIKKKNYQTYNKYESFSNKLWYVIKAPEYYNFNASFKQSLVLQNMFFYNKLLTLFNCYILFHCSYQNSENQVYPHFFIKSWLIFILSINISYSINWEE